MELSGKTGLCHKTLHTYRQLTTFQVTLVKSSALDSTLPARTSPLEAWTATYTFGTLLETATTMAC